MMRALAERHARPPAARHGRGHLARHHRDLHLCAGARSRSMRTSRAATRRCATRRASTSASRCPIVTHPSAAAVIDAVAAARGRPRHLPPRPGRLGGRVVARPRRRHDRPKIIARLPFIERPGHPAGTPVFVISKPLADAAVRDVVLYAAQFERWRERRERGAAPALAARSSPAPADAQRPVRAHRRSRARRARALARALTRGRRRPRRPRRDRQPCRAFPREMSSCAELALEPPLGRNMSHRPGRSARHDLPIDADKPATRAIQETMSARPQPRPGVCRSRPMCPARAARRASRRSTSCPRTRRRSGRSRRRSTPIGARPSDLELYPDGVGHGAARGDRRAATASIPTRIVCGAGSDELLNLLAHAYVGPGDEGIFTEHGFLVYRIAILAAGGTPVVAPETNYTADVDAILAARDADGPRSSSSPIPNNPTGTYLPFDEVQAPARGPAAARAAGARRGLRRIRPPQRLRGRARAGRDRRERRDDAHLLEDLRPRRRCGSAGLLPGRAVVDALNRIRGPFNVNGAGDRRRHRGDRRRRACRRRPSRTTRRWLPWLTRGDRGARPQGDAERRQLRADPFPDEPGRTPQDADAFLTQRGLILRRVAAYGLPHALRMTIGTEEANRLVVAALARLHGGRDA